MNGVPIGISGYHHKNMALIITLNKYIYIYIYNVIYSKKTK